MGTLECSNSPAWSHTRDQMLRSCPRRYYYHYYLATAGAKPGASPLARYAYVLKHLTNLDMVLGVAIHSAAQELARSARDGRPAPSPDALRVSVRDALNAAYAPSKNPAAFARCPRQRTMLREMFLLRGRR